MTTTVTLPKISGTASMLGDPEAHRSGDASASCPGSPVPCAARSDLEWVPAKEQEGVPLAQRQLCLQCPARRWCLAPAIETGSQGYWAGSSDGHCSGMARSASSTPRSASSPSRNPRTCRGWGRCGPTVEIGAGARSASGATPTPSSSSAAGCPRGGPSPTCPWPRETVHTEVRRLSERSTWC